MWTSYYMCGGKYDIDDTVLVESHSRTQSFAIAAKVVNPVL